MSVCSCPFLPVATWMKASWFRSWAASFAVNWASRRILMRLVEATALADNSSTTRISGAPSPKCSSTAAFNFAAISSLVCVRTGGRISLTVVSSARLDCTFSASSSGVAGS